MIFRKQWAEIAPLQGWSQESEDEAHSQVVTGQPEDLYPSVAFGLSCATRPMKRQAFSLPLNALLMGRADEIVTQAEKAKREGFVHAKVKIGCFSPEEALPLVKELQKHFVLRLDVNRKWSIDEARSFFSHFAKTAFEYVEEPVNDLDGLSTFTHPFALDESLRDHPEILRRPLPNLCALIIKPTLTGSFETCQKWTQLGVQVVISSAFERGVGIFHLAHFALELAGKDVPASLDTYRHLNDDLLERPLKVKDGRLFLPETIAPRSDLRRQGDCLRYT